MFPIIFFESSYHIEIIHFYVGKLIHVYQKYYCRYVNNDLFLILGDNIFILLVNVQGCTSKVQYGIVSQAKRDFKVKILPKKLPLVRKYVVQNSLPLSREYVFKKKKICVLLNLITRANISLICGFFGFFSQLCD